MIFENDVAWRNAAVAWSAGLNEVKVGLMDFIGKNLTPHGTAFRSELLYRADAVIGEMLENGGRRPKIATKIHRSLIEPKSGENRRL